MATSADDLKAISETARDLAYRQIDAQFESSNNLDTKATGVLAFDVAAIAAVFAAKDLFYRWTWAVPAAFLIFAAVFALTSIRAIEWDDGPDPREFYDKATKAGAPLGSAAAANVDLVSELGGPKGSINLNDKALRRKASWFLRALWTTVVAGIASGALIAVSR